MLHLEPSRARRVVLSGAVDLQVDGMTLRDLEILEPQQGSRSLYSIINRTRTLGGAQALYDRLRRPFADADRIRSVQQTVHCIESNLAAFRQFPADMTIVGVQNYISSGLGVIEAGNRADWHLAAFELRYFEFGDYLKIYRGVEHTLLFMRALLSIARHPGLADAPGEVGGILAELRELLNAQSLEQLPLEERHSLPYWKVLRADHVFRASRRDRFGRLIELSYQLDALVAMAEAGVRLNWAMPVIVDGAELFVADARHPFLSEPTANTLDLRDEDRLVFLTGPNMAGKTTFMKTIGVVAYLAHLGMRVPARECRFSVCGALLTSIAVSDDLQSGFSFFRAEASRIKQITAQLTDGRRVFALLDEPFKGTNLHDALDATQAVLTVLAQQRGSFFLVASHLIELAGSLGAVRGATFRHFEAATSNGRLSFDYRLKPGVSTQRLGMKVLEQEGVLSALASLASQQRAGLALPMV